MTSPSPSPAATASASVQEPRNRYFLCFPNRVEAWNPLAGSHPEWIRTAYFGEVFRSLETHIDAGGLTVFLTADETSLPAIGDDVVAVLQEDQPSRVPTYFNQVRATFTCHGTSQSLRPNPLTDPSIPNLLSSGIYLTSLVRRTPTKAREAILRATSGAPLPPIYTIPLGYANQMDVPFVPFGERTQDVFFAGSVVHREGRVAPWRRWFRSPKHASREAMVDELQALTARRPDVKLDLHIRPSFRDAISQPASWYSERMMDARICPIPRGTSLESFRFFEALRAGCIPIVEALPSRWFYDDAPAIRIRRWEEAPAHIEGLIDDPDAMHAMHDAVRDWWTTRCSGEAVGRFMADKLNALS